MTDRIDLSDRLAYRLSTLYNKISIWAARTYLDKCGISMTEWRVLAVLVQSGATTARKICDYSTMDKGNVSRGVNKLAKAGEIKERIDPEDGRSTLLTITAKGRRTYAKVKKYSDYREDLFTQALGRSERAQFVALMDKLHLVADRLVAETENDK